MTEPLRFSILKQMAKSPAHAKWAMDHPTPDTAAMRMGRFVHSIFLGAGAGAEIPIVFDGERRGNVWKEFKAAHEGYDIITASEFDTVGAMASALHANTEARSLLMGTRERTIFFDYAGRNCRATPDTFSAQHLTELKTTVDASPMRFPYIATRLSYVAQLAFYRDALEISGIGKPDTVSIVAVEVKPPHAVGVFAVTPAALEFGRRQYRAWMEQFLVSERSNDWPSYGPGVLDAPPEDDELAWTDREAAVEVD